MHHMVLALITPLRSSVNQQSHRLSVRFLIGCRNEANHMLIKDVHSVVVLVTDPAIKVCLVCSCAVRLRSARVLPPSQSSTLQRSLFSFPILYVPSLSLHRRSPRSITPNFPPQIPTRKLPYLHRNSLLTTHSMISNGVNQTRTYGSTSFSQARNRTSNPSSD